MGLTSFGLASGGGQQKIFQITLPPYWSDGVHKSINFQVPIFFRLAGANRLTDYYSYTLDLQLYTTIYVKDTSNNIIDTLNNATIQGNPNTKQVIELSTGTLSYSAYVFFNNLLFTYCPRAYTASQTLVFYSRVAWQVHSSSINALTPTYAGLIYNNNNNTTDKSIFSNNVNYASGYSDVSISILDTSYSITETQTTSNNYGEINCLNLRSSGLTQLTDAEISGNITFSGSTLSNCILKPLYYYPSYDSDWFYVTTNQTYSKNIFTAPWNYTINITYPPSLQVLFSFSDNPNLNTDRVFDITGQGMNSSFSQSYIFRYTNSRSISIKTGVNNVALVIENTSNANLSYTFGYYRIILR